MKKALLKVTDVLRPVLKAIFPTSFLRKIKNKMYGSDFNDFSKVNLCRADASRFEQGINVISNIRVDSGVGQSSRLVVTAVKESGYQFGVYNTDYPKEPSMTNTSCDEYFTQDLKYCVNLVCVNQQDYGEVFYYLGRDKFDYHYNIAFWIWELKDFPKEWAGRIDLVDEIWVPSRHSAEGVSKLTDKPVKVMPYCITAEFDENIGRKELGLPEDKFLYMIAYDSGSGMLRKNPHAALESFKRAFPKEDQNVGLVIKISGNAAKDKEELGKLFEGYSNIYFIDKNLSRKAMNSLTRSVDVYVSLHRAEGFGLILAEAMLLGTPCIATNWSSNTEFMNEETGCMVDYKMVPIPENVTFFSGMGQWADADIDDAVRYMRRLYEDKAFYEKIRDNGQRYIKENMSIAAVGKMVRERVSEIYDNLRID